MGDPGLAAAMGLSLSPGGEDEGDGALPLLIINWTKVAGLSERPKPDTAEYQTYSRLVDAFVADADGECERMFSADAAFHSTTTRWDDDLSRLEAALPDCWLGTLDLPDAASAAVMWSAITRRTQWAAVDQLKAIIADCRRPLLWKYLMALEAESLAIRQTLVALDSNKKGASAAGAAAADSAGDAAAAGAAAGPPESWEDREDEEFIDEQGERAAPSSAAASTAELNVLDQMAAMCLHRHARIGCSEAEHAQQLAAKHLALKERWVLEFGELPPRALWADCDGVDRKEQDGGGRDAGEDYGDYGDYEDCGAGEDYEEGDGGEEDFADDEDDDGADPSQLVLQLGALRFDRGPVH